MWQDPFDELPLYEPDWYLCRVLPEPDWRMKNRGTLFPRLNPYRPLREWLALVIEIACVVLQAFRRAAPQRTQSAECECTVRWLTLTRSQVRSFTMTLIRLFSVSI
jgi:hypothetical protein